MKKMLAVLTAAFLFSAVPKLFAEDLKRTESDIATFNIGASSDIALGISSMGIVYNTEGIINVHEEFPFLTAPSTINVLAIVVTTASLVAGPTYFWGSPGGTPQSLTQPKFPSPIIINLDFGPALTKSTVTFTATATVSGIDSTGSSRTVSIKLSTDVASTGFAFAYISTITLGIAASTHTNNNPLAYLSFGTTNQIGLANDILNNGDIYAVWQNNVVQTTVTASGIYNTWTPDILPNYDVATSTMVRNRYGVSYKAKQSPPRRVGPNRLINLP